MSEKNLTEDLRKDIEAVGRISVIPSMLEVICRTTGMGFAAIARVTDAHWIACAVRDEISFGIRPGDELELETTICNEIRQHQQAVVIDNVAQHDVFRSHRTPAHYGFQSYISVPIIRKDGSFFGTLCAIDPKPAKVNTPETINMFNLFAELISFHLSASDLLAHTEARLTEEKKISELRDQFISILGHDLRNPVGAVLMSAEYLLEQPDAEEIKKVATVIKNSAFRMSGLISNILDFARGRLGDGLVLDMNNCASLPDILNQVVLELQTLNPGHIIKTDLHLKETMECDADRIGQLFSNLLGNAITYSRKNTPIEVSALDTNGLFTLSVTNYGDKIPDHIIGHLFHPFYRDKEQSDKKGLGLGLYISHEIAKAHGGELKVESNDEKTTFTLEMPVKKN